MLVDGPRLREAAMGPSHARKRASVCNHLPIMRAMPLTIGRPGLGKDVVGDVVRFDAERVSE